jgi:hypothetical protein
MTHFIRSASLFALAALVCASANAQGLVSVTQNNVPNIDVIPPQIEALTLTEESFAFVDRSHELTGARYDPGTGLLATANTGTLVPFPAYLLGAQYVANANDNRSAGTDATLNDYLVTYTVDTPGTAYLLLDNRLDGTASNGSSGSNSTDPDLGGNLAWVLNDGWTRVNTGIMPNGQADYIGIDEGGPTPADPSGRMHHDPGAGEGLNQFYAIYSREITAAGTFTTGGQRQATGAGNMYVVAYQPIPEPSTVVLATLGGFGIALAALRRRRIR